MNNEQNNNTIQNTETTNGFCDICGAQETDTTATLRNEGWYLGAREHFCPSCND